MAKKTDSDPLARWRRAQADYDEAIAVYMKGDSPKLTKDELIALIALSSKADKWRERYFKKHHQG